MIIDISFSCCRVFTFFARCCHCHIVRRSQNDNTATVSGDGVNSQQVYEYTAWLFTFRCYSLWMNGWMRVEHGMGKKRMMPFAYNLNESSE